MPTRNSRQTLQYCIAENVVAAMAARCRTATRSFTRCEVDNPFVSEERASDNAKASQYILDLLFNLTSKLDDHGRCFHLPL